MQSSAMLSLNPFHVSAIVHFHTGLSGEGYLAAETPLPKFPTGAQLLAQTLTMLVSWSGLFRNG